MAFENSTVAIHRNDYYHLDAFVQELASSKGYKRLERTGSTSWVDHKTKPRDSEVRFKLFNCPHHMEFGVRFAWLQRLGLPQTTLDSCHKCSGNPDFIGFDVHNDQESKDKIEAIVTNLPNAGEDLGS